MSIELTAEPKQAPMGWLDFCHNKPPFSIALDGYVYGGPKFAVTTTLFNPSNLPGPYVNFNHHEEVDRLATRATCGQVLMAIRQGLFTTFRDGYGVKARVYVNDCDEDVCTSYFLLKNQFFVESSVNPLLNRLVDLEDKLDSTAGAYPFPQDLPVLQELAWVFYPYRSFRLNGGLDRKESSEYEEIIHDVGRRIMEHITGRGKSMPLDARYERLGGGAGWALIREVGFNAKTGMFSDGIRAYVSVRERPNGRYTYTVGRMSPFVSFDVPRILSELNLEEQKLQGTESKDVWGGGNTIGGSPRVAGSALKPEEVSRIVEGIMRTS
jgi:hypothetical protein